MKKLQFLSYLFAALLMVTMVSCDEDDDSDDVIPGKEALLTAEVWTGDKIFLGEQDVTLLYQDRIKSTTLEFNTDGTYTFNSDGTERNGTWEFANDETQIIMDKGAAEELTVDVKRLTSTELWAEGKFYDIGQDLEVRFVR